ncbi:Transposase, Mutator family [Enhygromyxa salina]|uniref:Transposase, Mutator family n=1 Tax=Enhygromyxa salina TaxID=215803 RepID=A0A2S9YHR6_9BACT|nr:Transposase, Mutator family [Enhygromyxa salina]
MGELRSSGEDGDYLDEIERVLKRNLSAALRLAQTNHLASLEVILLAADRARREALHAATIVHGRRLASFADRKAGSYDEALSATWSIVYEAILTWSASGSFEAWFKQILRHEAYEFDRRRGRQKRWEERYESERALRGEPHATPMTGTTRQGQRLSLQAFVDSLGAIDRDLWVRGMELEMQKLDREDIYAALACDHSLSQDAIKGRLVRLRRQCRRLVGTHEGMADLVALWLGSERQGDEFVIVAAGITVNDFKKQLMFRRVSEVGRSAFGRLLETLIERNLPRDRKLLVVTDRSPGVVKALQIHLGADAVIQPCLTALTRAVVDILPEARRGSFTTKILRAYRRQDLAHAQSELEALVARLEPISPPAAELLSRELARSLTTKRFQLPTSLEDQLSHVRFIANESGHGQVSGNWLAGLFSNLRSRRSQEYRKVALARLADELNTIRRDDEAAA